MWFLFKPVRWGFSGGEAKTCTQVRGNLIVRTRPSRLLRK